MVPKVGRLRSILLAVVASVLATECGALTAEAVGLAMLSKSSPTDHKATSVTDQRAQRRLRKSDTWLANIVESLDDVEKALTKLTKGQSNVEKVKRYDILVDNIAASFVKLEDMGYTPAKLQNAIKNGEMVVEKPHWFLQAFETYWKTSPRLNTNA
ncbi:RXLR domain-containing protein [Phytophthora infestans]|uniref:RxLR effector protein n=1 Tax=Phytophthora infestans TaxID=4787 RepID=A0A833SPL6_PHYIN|nr:RXLR domain-containing protein [Phytophthora infestans]